VIDANGTVWAAFEADQFYGASGVITDTLSVLKVTPDGTSSTFALHTFTGDFSTSGILSGPLSVIPNGQGGVLVSVEADTYTNFVQLIDRAYHVSNVSSGGSSTNFTFPSAMANMVLGENGIAYADSAGNEIAFDVSSGKSLWTYQTGTSHLIGATSDGLIVNQSGLGLVTLDSTGAVATSMGTSVLTALPTSFERWAGILNNSFADFIGPTTSFATNEYPVAFGDPQSQNRRESPHPVNFRVLRATPANNQLVPLIEEVIAWDSSTGKSADLKGCNIREQVTYEGPGTNQTCLNNPSLSCFFPISPPWPQASKGSGYPTPGPPPIPADLVIPFTILISIPNQANSDQPGGKDKVRFAPDLRFVKPYSNSSFTATQIHQYQCPEMGEKWETFSKPFKIVRQLTKDSSGKWTIIVKKTGSAIDVMDSAPLAQQ
jgi:hypothetical protein